MPSRQLPQLQPGKQARKHIDGARGNYQRYQRFLQTPEDAGWALVVLFYAALQLVQAHAIAKSGRLQEPLPANHNERIKYVKKHLGRMEADYIALEEASKLVRYALWQPTSEEAATYHDQEFARIRTHLAAQNIAWSE